MRMAQPSTIINHRALHLHILTETPDERFAALNAHVQYKRGALIMRYTIVFSRYLLRLVTFVRSALCVVEDMYDENNYEIVFRPSSVTFLDYLKERKKK